MNVEKIYSNQTNIFLLDDLLGDFYEELQSYYENLFMVYAEDLILDDSSYFILDESFVYFDDKRLKLILDYLYGLDNQIIILSSSMREKNILDSENYEYNFIKL